MHVVSTWMGELTVDVNQFRVQNGPKSAAMGSWAARWIYPRLGRSIGPIHTAK